MHSCSAQYKVCNLPWAGEEGQTMTGQSEGERGRAVFQPMASSGKPESVYNSSVCKQLSKVGMIKKM